MPSRPAVVHLIGSPVRGAPRLLVRDLLATIDTSRYRPAVAFLREGGEEREAFDIDCMLDEFEDLRVPLFLGSMERSWQVHDAGRLDRFLRELGARIVVGHLQRADVWSCLFGWWGRAHYIRAIHGQSAYWRARPTQPDFALKLADRFLASRADRIVCVSPEAKAILAEELGVPGNKLRWIRSGIDLERYRVDAPPLAGDRALTIGMITRVIAEKGIREFVDAIAALQRETPSLRAVVAGGGPDFEACTARARSRGASIEFLGHVTDVQSVLARIDVFALPSYEEGTPISLIEALAAGRIIVVSDVGGMPYVVENGRNGLVVPARDPAALEAAFRRVRDDPEFGQRLAKAALEDSNLYTVEQMGADWNRLYAEVLAGERGVQP